MTTKRKWAWCLLLLSCNYDTEMPDCYISIVHIHCLVSWLATSFEITQPACMWACKDVCVTTITFWSTHCPWTHLAASKMWESWTAAHTKTYSSQYDFMEHIKQLLKLLSEKKKYSVSISQKSLQLCYCMGGCIFFFTMSSHCKQTKQQHHAAITSSQFHYMFQGLF